MKTMKFYMGISLLAVLLLFSGCGKELDELPAGGSNTESPENLEQAEGELLRLRVSDAGYLDAGTGSRATDSGLKTTFEDGDKIGLFVVNNENEVLYANVPYTKNGEEWTATQNVRTKGYPVRVFAYYPYVEDTEITGKVDATAQDASAFFQTYIEGLDISNQSTQELYRQADVMACMVTVDNKETARKELELGMNHLMGLLVIDFPEEVTLTKVKYYLKGDEGHSWLVSEEKSYPFEPESENLTVQAFREEEGCRYICKSNQAVSFSGSFITYGSEKNYSVKDATVSAGSCKTYRISIKPFEPASPVLEEYTPQVGDFYMKNGSVLSSISESNKNDCVGIVYWVPTTTDPLEKHNATWLEEHPTCTHGLVVSLYDQSALSGSGNFKDIFDSDKDGVFRGYSNTKLFVSRYPDYNLITTYVALKNRSPLPSDMSSGWYMPSVAELVRLSNATAGTANIVINRLTQLAVLGVSIVSIDPSNTYWAACGIRDNSGSTYYVYLNAGIVAISSETWRFLRLVLAF